MSNNQQPIKAKTDSDIRRATYSLTYPTSIVILNNKFEYKQKFSTSTISGTSFIVHSQKINILYSLGTLVGVEFSQCSFFIDGKLDNTINKFTFRDCKFSNCFLGTLTYEEVKFENCKFIQCDFMHARFLNCVFEKIKFEGCTSMFCYFQNTEIDPSSFIHSNKMLAIEYENRGIGKNEIKALLKNLIKNNYDVSKSIYRSNLTSGNSNYTDKSLLIFKKMEIAHLANSFRYLNNLANSKKGPFFKCITKNRKLIIPILTKGLNIILTKGGTSLWRLVWVAVCILLIFNLFFFSSNISNTVFSFHDVTNLNGLSKYIKWLPLTLSDFLGFGFTAFKASNHFELDELILCASIGILWYALLIPVIIRKIYR